MSTLGVAQIPPAGTFETLHELRAGELHATLACNTLRQEEESGPRFDRTAQVVRVTWRGREYLSLRGLPDEFGLRGRGVLGYDEAEPGAGTFLKVGVGELRRTGTEPYQLGGRWPVVSGVVATIEAKEDELVARHSARVGPWTYKLVKHYQVTQAGRLTIRYALTNLSAAPIQVEHYNHNFFAFSPEADRAVKGYTVRMAFPAPSVPKAGIWQNVAGEIHLATQASTNRQPAWGWDLAAPPTLNKVRLQELGGSAAVTLTGDFTVARMALWARDAMVCPEIFLRATAAPNETLEWSRDYLFEL